MKDLIRHRLNENVTKSEVKTQIEKYVDSNDFKSKIELIVKDRIKSEKMLEDKIVEITKNVLTQLYKTLWTKRGFWSSTLSNKST
jgi:hypothetical protein